jgi:hypothetical protein
LLDSRPHAVGHRRERDRNGARNLERRSGEPFTAQVMAAMTLARPIQPVTIRGRTASSTPEMTRQKKAHSSTV